jgi:dipeptidyl aminopeptidase/acylaminoacyl peptidase
MRGRCSPWLAAALAAVALLAPAMVRAFSLEDVLGYAYPSGLTAAERGARIAWTVDVRGVRNVWAAQGPDFTPRQLTHNSGDDGQEITQLGFSPDGARLIWVRGGDHDANWPAEGGLAPDPGSAAEEPKVAIWMARFAGGAPAKLADGDAPALSARGELAFVKDGQAWTTTLDGKGKARRLFFDRGKVSDLTWSPDGRTLAFVSRRGDHAFIGLYSGPQRPLAYLAPSTSRDGEPRWSPDGSQIAFLRQAGDGGAPRPLLTETPRPWSIEVADAASGQAHAAWRSPGTLAGSLPEVEGEANLAWAAGARLVFIAETDGWPHLYSVAAAGGAPVLLTPGAFMVEHVGLAADKASVIFDANSGAAPDDGERRHLFRTSVDRAAATALTEGDGLEWGPVAADGGAVAFIGAGARQPPRVEIVGLDGAGRRAVNAAQRDFPAADLIAPRAVTFTSADGQKVHGQLFQKTGGAAPAPGLIFVHGGPPRQMLLGWHYLDYYANAYALNQYLAAHGFVVLSVNYRLGIGYGRAFQHAQKAGPAGASEYQDVVAGARFLQRLPGVDGARIGIWGGSYGGYLTALALARNSDIFKAGVDMHGVHDWSRYLFGHLGAPPSRFEKGDRDAAMASAWTSSPDADIGRWASPVLLIAGDDDRNVDFAQTVDLAQRLTERRVDFEELVIPNEIHGFLRYADWLAADAATARFLGERLGAAGQ